MADESPLADQQELQEGLERAADDGWPADPGALSAQTNPAEQLRRAITLLRRWHAVEPNQAAAHEIVPVIDLTRPDDAQVHELAGLLQGMTALADFLLANLERATGNDREAFLQSVAEQADQYFPNSLL